MGRFTNLRVFVRTKQKIYRTTFRSFADFQENVESSFFLRSHHPLLVNVRKISRVDLGGRTALVGVAAFDSIDWLSVSRRSLRHLGFALRR
jgi:DNA-binding LytR/AlgR family response regulator